MYSTGAAQDDDALKYPRDMRINGSHTSLLVQQSYKNTRTKCCTCD